MNKKYVCSKCRKYFDNLDKLDIYEVQQIAIPHFILETDNTSENKCAGIVRSLNIFDLILGTDIKIVQIIKILDNRYIKIPDNIYGVYILTTDSGKKYVGKSSKGKGVKQRFYSHLREAWTKKTIKNIDIYITETYKQAIRLENILLKEYQPYLNTIGTEKNENNDKYDYFISENGDIEKIQDIKLDIIRTIKYRGGEPIDIWSDGKFIPFSDYVKNNKDVIYPKNLIPTVDNILEFSQKIEIGSKELYIKISKTEKNKIEKIFDSKRKEWFNVKEFTLNNVDIMLNLIDNTKIKSILIDNNIISEGDDIINYHGYLINRNIGNNEIKIFSDNRFINIQIFMQNNSLDIPFNMEDISEDKLGESIFLEKIKNNELKKRVDDFFVWRRNEINNFFKKYDIKKEFIIPWLKCDVDNNELTFIKEIIELNRKLDKEYDIKIERLIKERPEDNIKKDPKGRRYDGLDNWDDWDNFEFKALKGDAYYLFKKRKELWRSKIDNMFERHKLTFRDIFDNEYMNWIRKKVLNYEPLQWQKDIIYLRKGIKLKLNDITQKFGEII